MQAKASQANIHVSPRKAKLVCDLIKNKPVTEALTILENTHKKTAVFLKKLLHQAIANATNNHAMQADKLYVYTVVANQGSTLKRTMPRAKGSADLIRKRHTHLKIVLSDDQNERKKEIDAIKKRIKKRATNNKGYSAKQRAANEKGLKVVRNEKIKVSKSVSKTEVKKETKVIKPVVNTQQKKEVTTKTKKPVNSASDKSKNTTKQSKPKAKAK